MFCRYQNSPKSPNCFKNISDADKAIEDHALATHASFSVYKPERECNSKGNMQSDRGITESICYFSMLTKWLQPWTKYLRQALDFKWNSKLRKSSISIFHEFFASIGIIFIWGGEAGGGALILWGFLDFSRFLGSWFPKVFFFLCGHGVVRQLVRQLVFNIFITNNHASFHLWGKQNLIKH